MSQIVLAEYDAEHRTLKLAEPLAGIPDRAPVRVSIEQEASGSRRSWSRLRGVLAPPAGEELERRIEEVFGSIRD